MNRRLLEYSPVFDIFSATPPQAVTAPSEARPLSDESADLALAAELLEAEVPADLKRVLGRAIARAGVLGARVARSPMGPLLIAELLRAVQALLAPPASPRPGLGGQPGTAVRLKLGARLFGLELEGLSPEDKEFALARQLVHFAGDAAREAGLAGAASPQAARAALRRAARQHAPGLLPSIPPSAGGCWTRQDGNIVLHDC